MATATNTNHSTTADPVNDAVRATVEASRRTIQSTQDATRLTRDLLDQSTEVSRKLYGAYTTGLTAGIKAAFEVQNAALSAGLTLLDTAAASNRQAAQQLAETARQAQQATLDAWQAGIHATDKLAAGKQPA